MKRFLLTALFLPLLVGCSHKATKAKVSPPPELPQQQAQTQKPSEAATSKASTAMPSISEAESQKPILTEMGIASWYGPPYHNRRGANGEIYDMNEMTAAHRTLPLNSIVRVTNIKTGHSAIVRITDRGPFIGERMLDLSLAAAKAVDVWAPGLAWVKMEVLETPVPIDIGGRWAVQVGAFESEAAALRMKRELMDRYRSAKILEFAGPTGDWVRIRVQKDDRQVAEEISRSLTTPEGGVFLVRLD